MEEVYLCLSELLDQNISSQEYFNTLPDKTRKKLLENDNVQTFSELQQQASEINLELN